MTSIATTSLHDLQKYFEDRMCKFEADLHKKAPGSIGSLADDFSEFRMFVLRTLQTLSHHMDTMSQDMDRMEMRSRRKMLLLHGVGEEDDENVVQVVTEVVKQRLRLATFSDSDIKRCHRMGRKTSSKPRPIVVKLHSVAVRDKLWFAKTKLKSSGVTLSEFLTRRRHTAFMAAREKFGVNRCWTREGSVYVLDADGNRHRVSSLSELDNIKCADTADKPLPKTIAAKTKRTATSSKR